MGDALGHYALDLTFIVCLMFPWPKEQNKPNSYKVVGTGERAHSCAPVTLSINYTLCKALYYNME